MKNCIFSALYKIMLTCTSFSSWASLLSPQILYKEISFSICIVTTCSLSSTNVRCTVGPFVDPVQLIKAVTMASVESNQWWPTNKWIIDNYLPVAIFHCCILLREQCVVVLLASFYTHSPLPFTVENKWILQYAFWGDKVVPCVFFFITRRSSTWQCLSNLDSFHYCVP